MVPNQVFFNFHCSVLNKPAKILPWRFIIALPRYTKLDFLTVIFSDYPAAINWVNPVPTMFLILFFYFLRRRLVFNLIAGKSILISNRHFYLALWSLTLRFFINNSKRLLLIWANLLKWLLQLLLVDFLMHKCSLASFCRLRACLLYLIRCFTLKGVIKLSYFLLVVLAYWASSEKLLASLLCLYHLFKLFFEV